MQVMQSIYTSHVFSALETKFLLEDHPFSEFSPGFGICQLALNVTPVDLLEVSIWTGTNQVFDAIGPLLKTTAPVFPDDYLFNFPIAPGERLVIKAVQTPTGTPTLRWAFRYLPA